MSKKTQSEARPELSHLDDVDEEGELPTVGTDVVVQNKVPEFTDIKVKSRLDKTQPTRINSTSKFTKKQKNEIDEEDEMSNQRNYGDKEAGEELNESSIGSESDFADLEFADGNNVDVE